MLSALRDRTRAPLKTTFAVAVAAAAVLSFGAPAHADPVRGKYVGHEPGTDSMVTVKKAGGEPRELSTNLLQLEVRGGKTLLTYCIDIETKVKKVGYTERGWNATNLGKDAQYVNWILHNSYPFISLEKLQKRASLDHKPSVRDAVAGIQTAIWHYSDGYALVPDSQRPAITKIYRYLTGDANDGRKSEPAPTLKLAPEKVSGEPGGLLGPIKVTTSAEQVNVSLKDAPEGARLLGPDKQTEVTTAQDGDKLWVSVPDDAPDGEATVKADVTGKVSPGRVFKSAKKSQTLILADSDKVTVRDRAVVKWTTAPTPAPGSHAEQVCKPDAGVHVVLTNEGDAAAEFTVTYGEESDAVTVGPGEAWKAVIPVREDTTYKITVKSGDYRKVYEGILDCQQNIPSPAPSTPSGGGGGGDLPQTGLNNLTMILGSGGALLLVGLALLLVVRRRRNA